MFSINNFIKRKCFGKVKYQKYFQKLYEIGLRGMNYGSGDEFEFSGELNAVEYAFNKSGTDKEFIIFDVGANLGNYSKKIIELFHDKKMTIHAFEPSKQIFAELTKNITNVGGGRIFYNNIGLGRASAIKKLYKHENISGLSSLYDRKLDHFHIALDQVEEIEIKSLDEYCTERNVEQIDYLKIDVEGHELEVIAGASKMIDEGKIKFIQFEFGGTDIDARIYFRDFYYLLKDHYSIHRIVKDGLVKMNGYKEEYEIFATINYLAELKSNFLELK